MLDSIANKVSISIKRANPEETCSVEVMQYSLGIILNTTFSLLMSLLIGLSLGNIMETLIFYISFSLLRVCSGGFHLKTATACNIVTTLICSLTPYFFHITGNSRWIINLISLTIMLLFAPNPDKNARIPFRLYPRLKLYSVFLVGLNFIIGSSVIGLAFFVQSLTVIPWKGVNKDEKISC
jgi:accessory gene regulator B